MSDQSPLFDSVSTTEDFSLLVQNSSDIITILEADATIRYISPAVESLLGYKPTELLGHNVFEYVHPEDKLSIQKVFSFIVERQPVPTKVDIRFCHLNGQWVYLDSLANNLLADPRVRGILVNSRDITHSKRVEAALRQSEQNYQTLYAAAQRQTQEIALLERVRTALASELELTSLFRTVVEAINETFGYAQVSLYILEEGLLLMQHQVGYHRVLTNIPISRGIMGRVVQTGQPVLLEDVQTDPSFLGAIENIQSEICVPLFDGSQAVGVLNVESINGVRLTQADMQLMLALSEHINVAIRRARLYSQVRLHEQELQRREEEFRALVENTPDVIARYDRQLRYLYINPAGIRSAIKLAGTAAQTYIGKTAPDLGNFPTDTHLLWQNGFKQVFETAQEQTIEFSMPTPLGLKSFQARLVPELATDGSVASVLSISRDITALKQIENTLRDGEASFRLLFANNPIPMYVYDLDSLRFLEVNDAAIQQYGYSRSEFLKLTIAEIRPTEDITELLEEIQRARTNTNRVKYWRHRRKNGQLLDVEVTTHTLEFAGRVALLVAAQDITARKQAEDALAAERERLAVTLRSITEGVITTNIQGQITSLNKAAEQLVGLQQGGVLGQPLTQVFQLVQSNVSQKGQIPIAKVLQNGETIEADNQSLLAARDRTERLIAYMCAPIYDRDSHIVGAVLAFHDITEKQKLADERLKASKLESLGLLAGGIAHDFNNLLTGVLTNMTLAKTHIERPDRKDLYEAQLYLEEAEKAVLRTKDLTRQLLTFAKGGAPIKKTALLPEIITESAQFVLHGSNVICEFGLPADLWAVEVDRGQLSQVIQNLVINSIQAMPTGGYIWIEGKNLALPAGAALPLPPGNYVKITVRDNGVGIPPDQLSKIFDPYFTTKAYGTGLGLATCYSIIKQHDGYINTASTPDIGTTFDIYLPASTKPIAISPQASPPLNLPTGRGKILVMDDEAIIRKAISRLLSYIGYEVAVAADGKEAIECYRQALAANRPFTAVIMDLTIRGGMGGKEAITHLLELDPQAKVIVSSGYSNDQIMANYLEHGFKGVVVKPFRMEELTKALEDVISGGQ